MRRLVMMATLLLSAQSCLSAAEPPGREYRISGVVVSSRDGSPVPYCRLTAYALVVAETTAGGTSEPAAQRPGVARAGSGSPPPEAKADGAGKFSIEVPHAGGWRLSATARGFRTQNYDAHEGFFSAIVLSESAPTFAVTFHLTPDSVLTGLIFDDSGEPVVPAQVSAELIPTAVPGEASHGSRPRQVGFAQTDDRGRYEIGGLAPGQYRLRVQAQPWYSSANRGVVQLRPNPATQANSGPPPDASLDFVYPITWFPGVDDEAAAESIKVAPGEERQADLRLTAIPSVHLKVPRPDILSDAPPTGRPQQQRMVSITRVGGNGVSGMQQMMPGGASGNEWDFGGLAPGTYEVRIPGPDGRSSEVRRIEVKPGSPAVLTMEGAKPLVRVQLELDGVANSESGAVEFVDTETGERITSAPNNRGRGGVQRDNQGGDADLDDEPEPTNRTVMLEPHSYEVYVNGGGSAYLTGLAADGAKVAGRVVTIAGAATVTLHLANKHAQLDGVARIGGGPAVGAMVLLVPATLGTSGSLTEIERAETNTDGSFRISSVTPGPYILVAIDRGWNVDWRNSATLGPYLLRGVPVNLRPSAKDRVELEAVAPN